MHPFKPVQVKPDSIRKYVGIKDILNREIYTEERLRFKFVKELRKHIVFEGEFVWNPDELRYEIDIFDDDSYTCLSYLSNGQMYDFELI